MEIVVIPNKYDARKKNELEETIGVILTCGSFAERHVNDPPERYFLYPLRKFTALCRIRFNLPVICRMVLCRTSIRAQSPKGSS